MHVQEPYVIGIDCSLGVDDASYDILPLLLSAVSLDTFDEYQRDVERLLPLFVFGEY